MKARPWTGSKSTPGSRRHAPSRASRLRSEAVEVKSESQRRDRTHIRRRNLVSPAFAGLDQDATVLLIAAA